MTVTLTTLGTFIADGSGILRPAVVEGYTRREAIEGYRELMADQIKERGPVRPGASR